MFLLPQTRENEKRMIQKKIESLFNDKLKKRNRNRQKDEKKASKIDISTKKSKIQNLLEKKVKTFLNGKS